MLTILEKKLRVIPEQVMGRPVKILVFLEKCTNCLLIGVHIMFNKSLNERAFLNIRRTAAIFGVKTVFLLKFLNFYGV